MQLTDRQQEITRIVRENGPITGEMIHLTAELPEDMRRLIDQAIEQGEERE